jgi:hypothetical protein
MHRYNDICGEGPLPLPLSTDMTGNAKALEWPLESESGTMVLGVTVGIPAAKSPSSLVPLFKDSSHPLPSELIPAAGASTCLAPPRASLS